MPLTHALLLNAQPREKPYRLFDQQGLYLEVSPRGSKWWRVKYRFEQRENRLSVGTFPEVSVKAARERCREIRAQVAAGIDPSAERKKAKQRSARRHETFEVIACEWYGTFAGRLTPGHGDRILRRLETYVFPWIGAVPIREVTAVDVLECLQRLQQQNTHETARRVLRYCRQTVRHAVATGRAEFDVLSHLGSVLGPRNVQHRASIRTPKEVGALLLAIDGYDGRLVTQLALRFAALVFVRPGELRHATWSDFDFLQSEWRIPANQMKSRQPHIVPLSKQAMSLLRELQPVTGASQYVFPGERSGDRPMSNNTLNAALRRLGYGHNEMTAHGFRSVASTLLNELGWSADAVERQLAHGERDGVRAVYNYAQFLPERRLMMQGWANYLDHLRSQAHARKQASRDSGCEIRNTESQSQLSWLGPRRTRLMQMDLQACNDQQF